MDIIKLIKENDLVKVALVLLAIYLYITYSKKETLDNVSAPDQVPVTQAPVLIESCAQGSTCGPVTQAPVPEVGTILTDQDHQDQIDAIVAGGNKITPDELLPKYDDSNKFAQENPVASLLKEQNFLISGYHTGINTVMQSNKIPYHDLRSCPPIVKEQVGPWSQSSFEKPAGAGRRQFDIGSY